MAIQRVHIYNNAAARFGHRISLINIPINDDPQNDVAVSGCTQLDAVLQSCNVYQDQEGAQEDPRSGGLRRIDLRSISQGGTNVYRVYRCREKERQRESKKEIKII